MDSNTQYRIEITCEVCGTKKLADKYDVEKGMGRFCSRKCSNRSRKIHGNNRNESFVDYKPDKPSGCPVKVGLCTDCYLDDCTYKGR